MLNRTERVVAAVAVAVLLAGVVRAAYSDQPAALSRTADVVAAAPTQPPAIRRTVGPVAPRAVAPRRLTHRPATPPPAPPAPPQTGCPPPKRHPSSWTPKPLGPPHVPDARLPAARPRTAKAAGLAAVSGKGIWVTNWPKDRVDVPALVAKVKRAGLSSIWVRTGGSRQGYYGDQVLPALVPAAHRAGLKVVAWDFPFLSDPVADAGRAHRALAAGIDAFAPDIETEAEGTYASSRRVALYLSLVRRYAGSRPIAATVPRPTSTRLASFPYAAFAPYADVFVPMVYWSCNEPGALVMQSLQRLGRWLPVAPVGQAYDMRTDGGRAGLPTRTETWRFLDVARRGGAVGASLWTIETIGGGQWDALSRYPWGR